MTPYEYSARCANGAAVRGTIEAADENSALAQLVGMGLTNVTVGTIRRPTFRKPIGTDDFIFFNDQLASLASAGMALDVGLRLLARDVHSSKLRETIEAISADLERGTPLDQAIERQSDRLPPLYGRVLSAGLASGQLSATLFNLSNHLRFVGQTRRLIVHALAYPLLVCLLAFGVACAFMIYVVPDFESIFEDFNVSPPVTTQLLISASHGLPMVLLILGCVVAGITFLILLSNLSPRGRLARQRLAVRIPLLGRLLLDSLRARLLRGLAQGVASGLPLPEALRLAADATGNLAGIAESEAAAKVIESGGSALQAMSDTRFIPPILGYTFSVARSPEDTRDALIQLAEGYSARALHTQFALRTWLPALAIFMVGVFVALIIFGLFLPVVNLVNSVAG